METLNEAVFSRFKALCTETDIPIALRHKQSRFVMMVALLVIKATQLGYELSFGDAWARTGHMKNSLHYIRLAIDLNLFKGGKYLADSDAHRELGEFWESIGGSWGGRFGDGNHYSLGHGGRR
uniref:Putative peptidase n=1 Tax=viral metagenome TaxID=1070528 RepID=A0A6M3JVF3_9ZZZZ